MLALGFTQPPAGSGPLPLIKFNKSADDNWLTVISFTSLLLCQSCPAFLGILGGLVILLLQLGTCTLPIYYFSFLVKFSLLYLANTFFFFFFFSV